MIVAAVRWNTKETRLIANHYGGTVPLAETGGEGVEPSTLLLKGSSNIYVIDASLMPSASSGHPVATVMACALKAADVILGNAGQSN